MAQRLDPLERAASLSRLGQLARRGKLAQGILLVGPEGSGKLAAALRLAAVLQCGDDERCTRVMGSLRHPDLHVVFPAESGLTTDAYREILDGVAREPLARIRQPSSAIIAIGDPDRPHPCSVREIRRFTAAVPFEGGRRIVVVNDAHRMNRAAANALLKTLEEPSSSATLLLCTHQPHTLPATVRSRCARVRVPGLGEDELAAHLQAAHGMPAAAAAQAATVSGGNARAALDLIDPESQRVADWAATLLGWMLDGQTARLLKGAELVAKGGDPAGGKGKKISDPSLNASRDVGVRCLDFMAADLLALHRLQVGAKLPSAQRERLQGWVSMLGDRDASAMATTLLAARADLLRNLNVSLVLTDAFLAAATAGEAASHGTA